MFFPLLTVGGGERKGERHRDIEMTVRKGRGDVKRERERERTITKWERGKERRGGGVGGEKKGRNLRQSEREREGGRVREI